MDLLPDVGSIVVCDDIYRLSLTLGVVHQRELLGKHEGLALGCSEHKLAEPKELLGVYHTCHSLDVDQLIVDQWLVHSLRSLRVLHVAGDLPVELGDHPVGDLQDLVEVNGASEGVFGFFEPEVLLTNKFILRFNFLHDFIEKQMDGLPLAILDLVKVVQEAVDVLGRVDGDEVASALVLQVGQSSLCLFALLDLGGK